MSSVCFSSGADRRPLSGPELELVARRFAVLADPLRLRLVHALFTGEHSVGELVAATGGSQTNVSRDLALLTQARVVARRKQGVRALYSITDPTIFALCELVCTSLENALSEQAHLLRRTESGRAS